MFLNRNVGYKVLSLESYIGIMFASVLSYLVKKRSV